MSNTTQLIPTIHVVGTSLPEVWEESVLKTWKHGMRMPTQYDSETDPMSRDVTAMLVVTDPFAEPRYHRNFPDSFYGLYKYVAEVLDGVDDDARAALGTYTYHERMTKYGVWAWDDADQNPNGPYAEVNLHEVNQLDNVLDALTECPYTRRAQATIWQPWKDYNDEYPACLQRLWFRVIPREGAEYLCMSVEMRSNDGLMAALMNATAFTELQRRMAAQLAKRLGRPIKVGQYTHRADSYHIYGSRFDKMEAFLKDVEGRRTWEERTWTTEQANALGLEDARIAVEKQYGLGDDWLRYDNL